MEGKSVVIAGGAGGLGLVTAEMMAARGARVALIDLDGTALEQACGSLAAKGYDAVAIEGDITTKDGARNLFDQAAASFGRAGSFGRIDGMVNCAGIYPRVPILEITDDQWDASFRVNVRGTHNLMVAAVRHMQPYRAGRIVNISSVDAFKAHPQNAHYAATKAAVVSLTRSFALAFAKDQLLINSVAPAGIATEKAKASGFMAELVAANPLGRAAEPGDIAEMVIFLASSANRYVTGENVIVSGGYIMA